MNLGTTAHLVEMELMCEPRYCLHSRDGVGSAYLVGMDVAGS